MLALRHLRGWGVARTRGAAGPCPLVPSSPVQPHVGHLCPSPCLEGKVSFLFLSLMGGAAATGQK